MLGYSSHGRTKSGGSGGFGVGGGGGGGGGALAQCRRSFGKSHGSVGGGYGGGQATAGERAVWVRDEAEGFVGVHGG